MRSEEYLIIAIVLVVLLAVAAAVLVLPIIALVRTRRIGELVRRVVALEDEMRRLSVTEYSTEPVTTLPTVTDQPPVAKAAAETEPIPEVLPARKPAPAFNIEAFIGGRALGWIAVILLLFAGGFFLRLVFEQGIIDELGRVAIGLFLGLALCVGGWQLHRRGWRIFSQFLTAGGIVLLYLSTFASLSFYNLLPREHAAVFLILIIAEGAALALLYEAPAIAIMSVIGGLLTPILLRSDHDQYQSLFTYLIVLNAGFLGLTLFRAWPALGTVALVGTNILFWLWYDANYHPEKRLAALVFQTILFALFLTPGIVNHIWRRRLAGVEDLVRLTLLGFLFALALFILAEPDYDDWRGTIALALALVYTLFALLIAKTRPEDARQLFVATAIAMALVATAFAWQTDAVWIALGWSVQGVVLWWFGLRISSVALRGLGFTFLALAAWRLVFINTPDAHPVPFVPIVNQYGLPATAIALALLAAALFSRRYLGDRGGLDMVAMRLLGLGGVTLLWMVLSVEGYGYFDAQINALRFPEPTRWQMPDDFDPQRGFDKRWQDPAYERAVQEFADRQDQLRRSAQTTLSVLWAVFAVAALAVGFRLPSRPLRWFALGLFGLTLVKVAFIDTEQLRELYRVAAFLALSVMMALGAWGYQKVVRSKLLAGPNTDRPREAGAPGTDVGEPGA